MAELPDYQQKQYAFAAHIRDPENIPPPEGIEDRRMAIYHAHVCMDSPGDSVTLTAAATGTPVFRFAVHCPCKRQRQGLSANLICAGYEIGVGQSVSRDRPAQQSYGRGVAYDPPTARNARNTWITWVIWVIWVIGRRAGHG